MGSGHSGIPECCITLQLLDHSLVFLASFHAGHAKGDDFQATEVTPLCAEDIVQSLCNLHGMAGQRGITNAHIRDPGKCGLQSSQQFGLQLAIQILTSVCLLHIAANIGIKQQRITDVIAVLTEATDGNIHINACTGIHHTERNRAGGAIFVANEFLGVKVIYSLILGRLSTKGKTLANILKSIQNTAAQAATENRGFCRAVVNKFTGLGAEFGNLTLIHDHHTLAVCNSNHGAIGDHILTTLIIAGTTGNTLLALYSQHICFHCVTIKIFLPLIRQDAAQRTNTGFNKAHKSYLQICIDIRWKRNPVIPMLNSAHFLPVYCIISHIFLHFNSCCL